MAFAASPTLTQHHCMMGKNKDWLAWKQEYEWSNISTYRLLFQSLSTMKIQLSVLVYSCGTVVLMVLGQFSDIFRPRKLAKDHKGYGSAASWSSAKWTWSSSHWNVTCSHHDKDEKSDLGMALLNNNRSLNVW